MLIIPDEKISGYLDYPKLIAALKEIFQSDYTLPLRHHHFYKTENGDENTLILMPVWNNEFMGMKQVTVAPANAAQNMPSIFAQYILSNSKTGQPLALMNAAELTSRRTACTSALASSYLSRENAENLLVVGGGKVLLPHRQSLRQQPQHPGTQGGGVVDDERVPRIGEPQRIEEITGPRDDLRLGHSAQQPGVTQQLGAGQPVEHADAVGEHTHARFRLCGVLPHVRTEHPGGSRIRTQQARGHRERRGLAGAVRAEQAEHGSGGHIEGETVDGDLLPELLAKPAKGEDGRGRCGVGHDSHPTTAVRPRTSAARGSRETKPGRRQRSRPAKRSMSLLVPETMMRSWFVTIVFASA